MNFESELVDLLYGLITILVIAPHHPSTMPLAGSTKTWVDIAIDPVDAPYFTSLKQLDDWSAIPRKKLDAVLEYIPRPRPATPSDMGKLLVLTQP